MTEPFDPLAAIRAAQELYAAADERADRPRHRLLVEPHRVDALRTMAAYRGLDRDVEILGSPLVPPGMGYVLPPEQPIEELLQPLPLRLSDAPPSWEQVRQEALEALQAKLREDWLEEYRRRPPRAITTITGI